MSTYAPIVLFAYNRPDYLARTVEALLQNEFAAESDLHIFSDGAKNSDDQTQVNAVREYIKTIRGFKLLRVYNRETNAGLANSVIAGVSEVCAAYGRVIVLEDDLITSPYFLRYMNDALQCYVDDDDVWAISGHLFSVEGDLPETFFIRHANSLGWGTWQRAWRKCNFDAEALLAELAQRDAGFDFDFYGSHPYMTMLRRQISGDVDSWAIRWYATLFLHNALSLYPCRSLTNHIGDQSGTHCKPLFTAVYEVPVSDTPIQVLRRDRCENTEHRKIFSQYYSYGIKKRYFAVFRENISKNKTKIDRLS